MGERKGNEEARRGTDLHAFSVPGVFQLLPQVAITAAPRGRCRSLATKSHTPLVTLSAGEGDPAWTPTGLCRGEV